MNGVVAASASPLWYLTRGSGVVALILLTAVVVLGIAGALRWHSRLLPRLVVAELHRRLTLLAVVFLAVHVVTTIADSYTPIGLVDAFIPFLASYRPLWLGLGALACDLLAALVVTSLVRVRLGYRAWRLTHWLAYAAWPLAEFHALGTGSDARFGWMAAIALLCLVAVGSGVVLRVSRAGLGSAAAACGAAGAFAILAAIWYETGPAQRGWAARSGTPARLLASASTAVRVDRAVVVRAPAAAIVLPASFAADISGRLTQSPPDESGMVTVRIDVRLRGEVGGEVRVALRGSPDPGGGISLTSSGVAFEGSGPTPVYEGSVVALDGQNIVADVTDPERSRLRLVLALQINQLTGAVHGRLEARRR